jgi:hypothetical protein
MLWCNAGANVFTAAPINECAIKYVPTCEVPDSDTTPLGLIIT